MTTSSDERLPSNWIPTTLGALGTFMKGSGIKRDEVSEDGVPCIRYGEIYTRYDNYVHAPVSRIPRTVAATALPLRTGDLLFAASGETAEEIGKCVAYLGEGEAYAGGDIVVLRPSAGNSLYLGHVLNHQSAALQKARLGQGDAVVHISARNLATVELLLPSDRDEQDRIAEALSDADEMLAGLDALIVKKRAVKLGAMQQLLSGETRLPGFSSEWKQRRLGDLGHTYGGLTGKKKGHFGSGLSLYIPFINIIRNTVIDVHALERVDIAVGESQRRVLKGDLFFNGSSETPEEVGLCSVLLDDLDDVFLNSFCIGYRLQPSAPVVGLFLAYLFRSDVGRNALYSLAQGATRYNLSKRALMNVELQLPTRDEQEAIAEVLADIDAELDTSARQRDKTQLIKQGMMQELLAGRTRLI